MELSKKDNMDILLTTLRNEVGKLSNDIVDLKMYIAILEGRVSKENTNNSVA